MTAGIEKLLLRRERLFQKRSALSIARSLGGLSAKWLDPNDPFRLKAVRRMMKRSAVSKQMAEQAIESLFRELTAAKLLALLKSEFGNPAVLDGFATVQGKKSFARSPRLITHVLPGNLPNPAVMSFVRGMLVKSANAGKISSKDSGLLPVYLESLRKHDPVLHGVNKLIGHKDLKKYLRFSDLALVYGNDETVAKLRQLIGASRHEGGTRLIGYGDRISAAILFKEVLGKRGADALASRVAKDVWFFDQRGCLSCFILLLEKSGECSPRDFTGKVAVQLERLNRGSPKPGFSRAARHATTPQGHPVLKRWSSRLAGQWCVLYDENLKNFPESRGEQVLRVKGFGGARWKRFVSFRNGCLQGMALAGSSVKMKEAALFLARLGVSRVCAPGELQRPPLNWHHEERPPLSNWVRWTDMEIYNG